jgi:hypothetical protein
MSNIQLDFEYLSSSIPVASWSLLPLARESKLKVQARVESINVELDDEKLNARVVSEFHVRFMRVNEAGDAELGDLAGEIRITVSIKYKILTEFSETSAGDLADAIYLDSINYNAAEIAAQVNQITKSSGVISPVTLDTNIILNHLRKGKAREIEVVKEEF